MTIIKGNYTSKTIKESLQNALNSNSNNIVYSVNFSNITGKLLITSTTSSLTAASLIMTESSSHKCIGFTILSTNAFDVNGSVKSLLSPNCIDLTNGIHTVHVHSNLLNNSIYASTKSYVETSLLGVIPITVNNFEIIQYDIAHAFMVNIKASYVGSIELELKDSRSNTLDLNG